MEKVLLRTMTRKSKLKDGKYDGVTVDAMLTTAKGKSYLRWLYYTIQNINFVEDVLYEIGISGNWIIEKPGVSKSSLTEWNAKIGSVLYAKAVKKQNAESMMYLKEQNYQKKISMLKAFQNSNHTKAYLQAKNHGR